MNFENPQIKYNRIEYNDFDMGELERLNVIAGKGIPVVLEDQNEGGETIKGTLDADLGFGKSINLDGGKKYTGKLIKIIRKEGPTTFIVTDDSVYRFMILDKREK